MFLTPWFPVSPVKGTLLPVQLAVPPVALIIVPELFLTSVTFKFTSVVRKLFPVLSNVRNVEAGDAGPPTLALNCNEVPSENNVVSVLALSINCMVPDKGVIIIFSDT